MREVIRITDGNMAQYQDIVDFAVAASSVTDNLMVVAKGEENKKQDITPFTKIGDISFYAVHSEDTAILYKSKVTDEEIETAVRNTIEDARICDMVQAMEDAFGGQDMFTTIDEWKPQVGVVQLYVLTNSKRHNGAGLLLCDEVLHRIWEKVGNYFLFPSSIHELTLLPDDGTYEKSDLDYMVRSINRNLNTEEKLSDRSFYYDGKLN